VQKPPKILGFLTLLLTGFSLTLFVFLVPSNLDAIIVFAKEHALLAPFLVIFWRMLAIVIPPLPGGVVSLAFLPAFGWFWSFIFAEMGVLLGTSIAFYIARKFREPFVRRFVPLQELHHWEEKLSARTEFLGFLVIRFTTGPVMDFISYVAGLSKISYSRFIIATLISILPDALYFYAGEKFYHTFYQENAYWSFVALAFFAIVVYVVYKSKFFQKR